NFGRGEFARCGQYLWQGFWVALILAAATLTTLAVADRPFVWSQHEAALVRAETIFFRIAIAGAVLKLTAHAAGQFLIGVDRPRLVLIAALTGMIVNIFAAWILIFGHFGAPPLGVAGAAWGTNIALAAELSMLL